MGQPSEEPSTFELTVDETTEQITAREGESLMEALRGAGYYSVVNGCNEGTCGACNVLYGENKIARSCIVDAEQFAGEDVTTAAGLVDEDGSLHPVQEEFLEHGAAQCGFCIPGMIVSAVQFLETDPDLSEESVRRAINGNLCRCTGYVQQIEAIQDAGERMEAGTEETDRIESGAETGAIERMDSGTTETDRMESKTEIRDPERES
jgi:carbon-monoxide dehydrogenase small subunit